MSVSSNRSRWLLRLLPPVRSMLALSPPSPIRPWGLCLRVVGVLVVAGALAAGPTCEAWAAVGPRSADELGAPLGSPQPSPFLNAPSSQSAPSSPSQGPSPTPTPTPTPNPAVPSGPLFGLLDPAHGGLGRDMWAGSEAGLVQRLLPALPVTPPSRAMRRLQERLLLSVALPPQPNSEAQPVPSLSLALLRLRAEKLAAMGASEAVLQLLAQVPGDSLTGDLEHLRLNAMLLTQSPQAVCGEMAQFRRGDDPSFARLRIFCALVAGRGEDAAAALDIARDQGLADPLLESATDLVRGRSAREIEHLPQPTPLSLALLRLVNKPIPADAAQTRDAALWRPILQGDAPVEARLLAAEKAEAAGVIETEVLRQAYNSVAFTREELAAPLSADRGPRSRALLFRAAQVQSAPLARAEIMARALSAAREQGQYFTAARVYGPMVAHLKPAPDLVGFSGHFARMLFAIGDYPAARYWLFLARQHGADLPEAANSAARLWALQRLSEAADDAPYQRGALAAWRKATADGTPDQVGRRTEVVFGLLDAMGHEVGDEAWLSLMDDRTEITATVPHPALWQVMRISAEKLRLGETVMLGLISLGPEGPGAAEPTNLYRVIASLRLIGLEDEARALAIEAAIANGV